MASSPPYGTPECIVASNRGPLEYYVDGDGSYSARYGSGGLVTVLLGALQRRSAIWVAVAMTPGDLLGVQARPNTSASLPPGLSDVTLRLLGLPPHTYEQYYYRISSGVLWPAQHALLDAVTHTTFTKQTRQDWEEGYCIANKIVADSLIQELLLHGSDIPVIIQDYHLYLVAEHVRRRFLDARLAHVIYIPWPDARYLAMLPKYMVLAIYRSLMMNDIVGFQTGHDARNFIVGATRFLDDAQIIEQSVCGPGTLRWRGRTIRVNLYPAMLSPAYVFAAANAQEIEGATQTASSQDRRAEAPQLILRVDRIEPTKNIVRGFRAYEYLLRVHPELQGRVTFQALLVPSRDGLSTHDTYERQVRQTIEEINARIGRPGWQPIVATYGNDRARALACLQHFDVLLVNPVIDGMNMVVKEGALLNRHRGALVLSETAGAHGVLGEHVLSIAPLDMEGTADALYRALTMPEDERTRRASRLREIVLKEDAITWFGEQLDALRESL